jgi:hypothetical protein
VASIETYLDEVCGQLHVNPAVAGDIRDELRGHLEDSVERYRREDSDAAAALRRALASFGEPAKLNTCLCLVHHGECVWLRRLKAMALGIAIGCLFSLLGTLGRQLGLAPLSLVVPGDGGLHSSQSIAAIAVGGVIGLLSAGRRGFFVGWTLGSLAWLIACAGVWVSGTVGGSVTPQESLSGFYGVLLAPVLGGLFGATVELSSGALLSAASRLRPGIR